MKKIVLIVFAVIFSFPIQAADESREKPTQHLKIADVTSMEDAKAIFLEKTLDNGENEASNECYSYL